MSTITTDIAYCPQCGRPKLSEAHPCPDCHPARSVPPPLPTPPARRSVLDLLLDPRSIQWLLASGGVLLAAGLVVWLASLGLFDNPAVVAAAMGVGTVGLLAAGWSVIRFSRHQIAGRAITLLACLVMPLNLWFYESHHLVTLDGHLWLAGVVCCALYAASAWTLKDSLFVYVLSAGVAMTGLLMLADVHRFTEVAAPSTLLVVLGLIALHVERLFPSAREDEQGGRNPFTRERFGRAFFWSAQALLGGGLLMLLGAQLSGYLTFPAIRRAFHLVVPQIVTDPAQRWWALALVAAGTYAYVYSDLVVRRVGTYLYVAAGTLVWGEVLAIDLFHLSGQPAALIVALSLTALGANVLQSFIARRFLATDATDFQRLTIPGAHLAVLNLIPVAYGAIRYFNSSHDIGYALAMLVAAAGCRVGAHLARTTSPRAAVVNLYTSAAATLIGLSTLLVAFGLPTLATQAPLLMLVPIGYLVASRAQRNGGALGPALARVAQAAAATLVAFTIVASVRHMVPTAFGPGTRPATTLVHAIVFAEAALFYALASALGGRPRNVYLATAAATAAAWQVLTFAGATATTGTVAFAALGLTMLTTVRLTLLARDPGASASPLLAATLRCANALTSLSFVSAALLTLSHLASRPAEVTPALQLAALAGLSLLAALLAGHSGWRRGYVAAALAQAALAGVALQRLMHLTPWQNAEVFSVGAGLLLLVTDHLGWHREHGRRTRDGVGAQLFLGSLLTALPLAIAALVGRYHGDISLVNELALVTVGIGLLVTGAICRIRATTLTGGAALAVHLAMMLIFLGLRAQLAVGVYLTLGGAAVFTTGLLLSIHRDRLATLPDRIKNREGLFKVLSWR